MRAGLETYAVKMRQPPHRSFFRNALARRARPVGAGRDAVHEYLIDQANLRVFHGAYSDRSDLGARDPLLDLEDIVVGLLQPHAPAEPRVLKLVVRILQSGSIDPARLLLLARRERALGVLTWLVGLIPAEERNDPIRDLEERLRRNPPRDKRRPSIRYDPRRLVRRAGLG
ncbi:MAG: hypothetical protein ACREQ9_10090 [Candidatus Binatia bacterium]